MAYQDVVLYPKNESAKAVIKCCPKRRGSETLIKGLHNKHMITFGHFVLVTRVLLHVVEPPLPVHLHLHLLALLQRRAHKMNSVGPLPRHPQHWDICNQPVVIRLREDYIK